MIDHFDRMGVVEVREGPGDRDHFPAVMEVEQLDPRDLRKRVLKTLLVRGADFASAATAPNVEQIEEDIDLGDIEKVNRFPHGLSQRR